MMKDRILLLVLVLLMAAAPVVAQQQEQATIQLTIEPAELTLALGEKTTLTATVRDAAGNIVDRPVLFFSQARRAVSVNASTGEVEALRPGDYLLTARVPAESTEGTSMPLGRGASAAAEVQITVSIPFPAIDSINFIGLPANYYHSTTVRPEIVIQDVNGGTRTDINAELSSSDSSVIKVTEFGLLRMVDEGAATISASAEGVTETIDVRVMNNPVESVRLTVNNTEVRTGDVLQFNATALDGRGSELADMPIEYSFRARTVDHANGSASSGMITEDGRFVADLPGEYTIIASAGNQVAIQTIWVEPRNVKKLVEVVGQGRVSDRKTSDLWVWAGPNGRDYAVTGTWGAEGHAYFWDVTDPTNIYMAATVRIDARTVNDVKVSEDGSICIISREGASNRRNGFVILDCSDIENKGVPILARYDDEMTGGVHNVYIYDEHVYALSSGQRYDVINIEDPTNPHRVGRFELETPGHSIHDVWVENGVAVSSNWTDGIVVVDVGGAGKGGSPQNPVQVGQYTYPSGWNHAGFPYWNADGKFYVFAGDEHFPADRNPQGIDRFSGPAVNAAGWIHVIEFDENYENPKEIARYQVPEGGTHNFWVEDDVLYIGYYNQGLRVVDISGELLGNLYTQGREIAYFVPDDPEGFKANAARTWGTMPFKGLVWVADNNSGLWAIRLVDPEEQ